MRDRDVPYVNGGRFRTLTAFRSNVVGVQAATIPVFRGISRQ
jgi:hypothetical protein